MKFRNALERQFCIHSLIWFSWHWGVLLLAVFFLPHGPLRVPAGWAFLAVDVSMAFYWCLLLYRVWLDETLKRARR